MPDIDIDTENIVALFQSPDFVPGPRKPARSTVFRWASKGIQIGDGSDRVKLQTVKINGIRCTSVEAISRFIRAANGLSNPATNAAG